MHRPFVRSPSFSGFLLALCGMSGVLPEVRAEPVWFRGNTHAHSLWSDGDDFPEMILAWYRDQNYDFAMLSDHNILASGERWMSVEAVARRQRVPGRPAIDKYRRRFGDGWVETRSRDGAEEVRLKTLAEFRGQLETPGRFLILQAEEITNTVNGKPVHVNAVHLPGSDPVEGIRDGTSVQSVLRANLAELAKRERETGQPVLAHLNHPNFQWGVTAEDVARVIEESFFEVYNGHPSVGHLGDETRPGTEAIWDLANTMRLAELGAAPLFGVASDDSHTYHGGPITPGRGWIMVRAETLEGNALIEAMRRGDFYASTGVFLEEVAYRAEERILRIRIRAREGVRHTTRLIGTHKLPDGTSGTIGEVLGEQTGLVVEFPIPRDVWYARATVTSDRPHPDPSFPGQTEQAWTQPVGWQ